MDTRPLSEVQRKILEAIREFVDDNIQQLAGLSSPSLVKYHLDILMERGHVTHKAGTARGVEITSDAEARRRASPVNVQIIGTIAAGHPIEAVQLPEDLYLTPDVAGTGNYALRVKGNSMIEDRIEDGDIVIIHKQESADDGATVVALLLDGPGDLTGEATLKRFYQEKSRVPGQPDRIRLEPRNPAMPILYADPEYVRVQGRVVGVIRRVD
jgi:repressor LexA